MSRTMHRGALLIALAGVVMSAGGCAIGADLLNPTFASQLGLDFQTPSLGSVVVQFSNQTDFPAIMGVRWTDTATDTTQNATSGLMNAQSVGNSIVLDCPVPNISPTGVTAGVAVNADGAASASVLTNAASTDAASTFVDVTYAGATLQQDVDFVCGDVIAVTLVQVGTGTAAEDFRVTVRRIPGR